MFPNESLNLIYTVFVHAVLSRVCAIEAEHVVQLVGLAVLPYATWVPFIHLSKAQLVLSVTPVTLVEAASLLIVKTTEVIFTTKTSCAPLLTNVASLKFTVQANSPAM